MEKSYIESIYYQIRLTARYLKMCSLQIFEKINAEITFDEFIALEILRQEGVMCHRDLAKLLLKDRANTGRIANSLEEKKYITIKTEQKNKRPVKNIIITEQGCQCVEQLLKKIKPILEVVDEKISKEDEHIMKQSLKKCRDTLESIMEIQI